MILTLKFTGFRLRNCEILHNQNHYASLKPSWTFRDEETAQCGALRWEIKQKSIIQNVYQVYDLHNNRLVSEAVTSGRKELLGDSGKNRQSLLHINLDGINYLLAGKPGAAHQYNWLDEKQCEIIHYDYSNFKDGITKLFRSSAYVMASIPDKPGSSHLILLFLGIFFIRRKYFH